MPTTRKSPRTSDIRAAGNGVRDAKPAPSFVDERVPPTETVLTRAYRGHAPAPSGRPNSNV
jgi:hypothetical protein